MICEGKPELYEEFERFLFAGPEIPPLGLAMQRASEFVGSRIDSHRPDEELDKIIRRSVEIFVTTAIEKIPALLLPKAVIAGQVQSVAELS